MLHRTSRRNRTRILIAAGLSLSMTLGHSIVASAETPHTVHYNQVVAQAAPINPITIPGLPVQQIDPNSARHIGAGLPNFGQLGPILASFGGAAIFAMLASLFGRNKQSITANRGSQPRVQAPAAAPQPARANQLNLHNPGNLAMTPRMQATPETTPAPPARAIASSRITVHWPRLMHRQLCKKPTASVPNLDSAPSCGTRT
mgnify:CR=1 FL=1